MYVGVSMNERVRAKYVAILSPFLYEPSLKKGAISAHRCVLPQKVCCVYCVCHMYTHTSIQTDQQLGVMRILFMRSFPSQKCDVYKHIS
jgi:hypothetical protein